LRTFLILIFLTFLTKILTFFLISPPPEDWETLDIPEEPFPPDFGSFHGENDLGDEVGIFFEDPPGPPPAPGVPARPNLPTSAFLRSGGTVTFLNDPLAPPGHTEAWGVNNARQVVGLYFDAQGKEHGFLYSQGSYSTVDYPGALASEALGINDAGQIVGTYLDSAGTHGFLLSGGTFTPPRRSSGRAWPYASPGYQ
jgi:probable HAF family extracellular repeat protein